MPWAHLCPNPQEDSLLLGVFACPHREEKNMSDAMPLGPNRSFTPSLAELNEKFNKIKEDAKTRLTKINGTTRRWARTAFQATKSAVHKVLRGAGRSAIVAGKYTGKGVGKTLTVSIRAVAWVLWMVSRVVGGGLSLGIYLVLAVYGIVLAILTVPAYAVGISYNWLTRVGRALVVHPLEWVVRQPRERTGEKISLRQFVHEERLMDEDKFWSAVDPFVEEDEDYTPPPGLGLTDPAVSSDDDPRLHTLGDDLRAEYDTYLKRIDYLLTHNGNHNSVSYWVGRANVMAYYLTGLEKGDEVSLAKDSINDLYHSYRAKNGSTPYVWSEVFRGHLEQMTLLQDHLATRP